MTSYNKENSVGFKSSSHIYTKKKDYDVSISIKRNMKKLVTLKFRRKALKTNHDRYKNW